MKTLTTKIKSFTTKVMTNDMSLIDAATLFFLLMGLSYVAIHVTDTLLKSHN